MIRPIMKDMFFLQQKSEPAGPADRQVIQDLTDTLKAHQMECVGMAANMIGVKKRIIIVHAGLFDMIMVNPVIVSRSEPYETEEGCLSLSGVRKTTRCRTITVSYHDQNFKQQKQVFRDWTAQIIQHEIDHCDGILI